MEVKKILYATNFKLPTYNVLEALLEMKKIGLEEIILLSGSPSKELKEKFYNYGITLRESDGSGPFFTRILDSAHKENASLIVAHLERENKKLFKASPTKYLIKNTHLPLLLINNKEFNVSKRGIFDAVIFATDWSRIVQSALDYILGLKEIIGVILKANRRKRDKVLLINVISVRDSILKKEVL